MSSIGVNMHNPTVKSINRLDSGVVAVDIGSYPMEVTLFFETDHLTAYAALAILTGTGLVPEPVLEDLRWAIRTRTQPEPLADWEKELLAST
jgi:hypothetical protein